MCHDQLTTPPLQPCPGCAGLFPPTDAPTHAYIGASPGCWAVYCEVLGREYGEQRNPRWHRHTVDAYAASHPGVESRRSIQSVAGHLIALHLLIDRGLEPSFVIKAIGAAVRSAPTFHWLEPPSFAGAMNILDIAATTTTQQHERAVYAWAESVWRAWQPHHATVRAWADALQK